MIGLTTNEVQMFVNNLTVIDFSYLDKVRGIVGESWIVDLILTGRRDEQGMVMDFGLVKKNIKKFIDDKVDHTLLVPTKLKNLYISADKTTVKFSTIKGDIFYQAPIQATSFIDSGEITKNSVSKLLQQSLQETIPDNIINIKISLREEKISGAFYHYSHGLKKHDGNCQRIAHGHRSKIIVRKNHIRDEILENNIADSFQDIYIGSKEDVKNIFIKDGVEYYEFFYKSPQGHFSLTLLKSCCYLIDCDSTVENIAENLWQKLSVEFPDDIIEIQTFEGVDKGAII